MMAFRRVTDLVPSVTYHSSTRRLLTNAKRLTSSPSKSRSLQPVSGRFSPAEPGKRVAVQTRQKLQTPTPIILVLEETEREVPGLLFSSAEPLHINDVGKEPADGNYWRFAFPRGACPKAVWWDHYKPVGTKASELRWTSGLMYPCFWKRFRVALAFSGTISSLLGGAGVLSVVSHTDGLVPLGTGLSVFAALTLPSLFYGIFRSRAFQEAWMGLVGGRTSGKGDSMLPYIHPDSKWEYEWRFRPTNVKAGDVVSLRNPTHFNTRFRKHGGPWLGKRVIAVGLDVLKMETLGFPHKTYFQVPKGHVFVLGDNRGASLDSRRFGPVPLHHISGRITASTLKSNPRWWWLGDWWKIPKMETAHFTIQDSAELEETRHQWEGKTWDRIPLKVGSASEKPRYEVKHPPLKVHHRKK